ncbi:MAG: MBOAT family protein [Syntrophobacteraceae bacterium]
MDLLSLDFALFMLVVLLLNWALMPRKSLYRLFLLSASYVFYGSLSQLFLLILLHFSVWTWALGLGIGLARTSLARRALLVAHLVIGVGGLVFFKYYDLLYESLNQVLARMATGPLLPELDVAVPVGISFFTFQGLSYTIDVYRDRQRVVKAPIDVCIYLAFFPTILSGPIMRAPDFIPQIGNRRLDRTSSSMGFSLIVTGLAKKLVLSSYLFDHVVQPVFENPGGFSSFSAALGALGYSIQILCDFSGYTDLVTGVAMLLGYSIPANFNNPYSARNLKEFWHRWHMSLSFWLRDYLYIPLGGNRRGLFFKYMNILITMTLGGLWHGARWNFLLWGCFHGVGLIVTHLFADLRRKLTGLHVEGRREASDSPVQKPWLVLGSAFSWLTTFGFVTIGWVFFGSSSLEQATALLGRIMALDATGNGLSSHVLAVVLFLITAVLLHEVFRLKLGNGLSRFLQMLPPPLQVVVLSILLVILLRLAPDGVPQFIYYQF